MCLFLYGCICISQKEIKKEGKFILSKKKRENKRGEKEREYNKEGTVSCL